MIPNITCVLGEPIAMQDAWRRGFESALTTRVKQLGADGFSSADERAEWTAKMQILSGGKNTIKWVNDGADPAPKYWPSVVVYRPARKREFYLPGAGDDIHPAFIAGGATYSGYWAGKYPGPYVTSNSKTILLSLPGFDGMTNALTGAALYLNYDSAVAQGKAGGNGSHCMTNAEWMEVAMSCWQEGFQPRGNNYYGRDASDPDTAEYYGVPAYWNNNKIARVLTGSGPVTWMHDGSPWGVWGMSGNYYQWATGFRQKAGEIQVIQNNDAALPGTDHSDATGAWEAMLADGSLVAPGTADTLKYDATNPISIVTTITTRTVDSEYANNYFGDVVGTSQDIAKLLGIAPADTAAGLGLDKFYLRNHETGAYSETLVRRGGHWVIGSHGGVFTLFLNYYRSASGGDLGARPAFL